MGKVRIVVHGGAGHTEAHRDGCELAAGLGFERLIAGDEALEAAVKAAVAMEDDGRFNAGRGSGIGLDDETKQMDAAVMDTRGRQAAVAAIEHVKNPVLVARFLADTPMRLIACQGATKFAHAAGFEVYDEITQEAREKRRETADALCEGEGGDWPPDWHTLDFKKLWNYKRRIQEVMPSYGHGTIGVVALDALGHFAVAVSTGGSGPMLYGRIGDTPVVGSGFYAGPLGAIAATGEGEYNLKVMIARAAYDLLEDGVPLQDALDRAVALVPKHVDTGLIGVTKDAGAGSTNTTMPLAIRGQ